MSENYNALWKMLHCTLCRCKEWCKALFTWDRDEVKSGWKFSLCSRETVRKSQIFQKMYPPCPPFSFLTVLCEHALFWSHENSRDRSEMYLCLHSFQRQITGNEQVFSCFYHFKSTTSNTFNLGGGGRENICGLSS